MPFNGLGTFTRLFSWVTDAANGVDISSSRTDAEDDGFAAGLSNCICRDGQTTILANLPMAGFVHTGVGNATSRDQYAAAGQIQDNSIIWCGTSAGTANALTLTPTPAISAYAAGQKFECLINIINTAAATLAVSGQTAKAINKSNGVGLVALVAGDLVPGTIVQFEYTGSVFQILNVRPYAHGADIASASTLNLDTATGDVIDVTGTTSITAITLSEGQARTTRFTGILTLTNGASLVLPTGANITTAAGDYAIWRGYASGVVRCVAYSRADGTTVGGGQTQVVNTTYNTATASGNLTIPGVNFAPKSVIVLMGVGGEAKRMSVGFADGTNMGCLYYNAATGNFGLTTTELIVVQDVAGTTQAYASLSSFTSTGCILSFVKVGSPTGIVNISFLFSR